MPFSYLAFSPLFRSPFSLQSFRLFDYLEPFGYRKCSTTKCLLYFSLKELSNLHELFSHLVVSFRRHEGCFCGRVVLCFSSLQWSFWSIVRFFSAQWSIFHWYLPISYASSLSIAALTHLLTYILFRA